MISLSILRKCHISSQAEDEEEGDQQGYSEDVEDDKEEETVDFPEENNPGSSSFNKRSFQRLQLTYQSMLVTAITPTF